MTALIPEMAPTWQQTLDWQPEAQQQAQFQRLFELILTGNQQLNLTRITNPQEFWEKHLWDSLRGVARFLKDETKSAGWRVVDIGTGAGFPGLPVAIVRPDWQLTLLDSTRKKTEFLKTVLVALNIQNAVTLNQRAEQLHQDPEHRGTYDLALIRAVGSASACAEYALPFLKVGGFAVLYRGNWTPEEAEDLQRVVQQSGSQISWVEDFITPLSQSTRHCLYLQKVAPTATHSLRSQPKQPRGKSP